MAEAPRLPHGDRSASSSTALFRGRPLRATADPDHLRRRLSGRLLQGVAGAQPATASAPPRTSSPGRISAGDPSFLTWPTAARAGTERDRDRVAHGAPPRPDAGLATRRGDGRARDLAPERSSGSSATRSSGSRTHSGATTRGSRLWRVAPGYVLATTTQPGVRQSASGSARPPPPTGARLDRCPGPGATPRAGRLTP